MKATSQQGPAFQVIFLSSTQPRGWGTGDPYEIGRSWQEGSLQNAGRIASAQSRKEAGFEPKVTVARPLDAYISKVLFFSEETFFSLPWYKVWVPLKVGHSHNEMISSPIVVMIGTFPSLNDLVSMEAQSEQKSKGNPGLSRFPFNGFLQSWLHLGLTHESFILGCLHS